MQELLKPVQIEDIENELFHKALGALTPEEQEWLGPENFGKICTATAHHIKPRQFYSTVFGLKSTELRQAGVKRFALTNRFKRILALPEVVEYVDALRDDDLEPWEETFHRLRAKAQEVLTRKLEFAAEQPDPSKDAVRLALSLMTQEEGKPTERTEHDIGERTVDLTKRLTDAAERVAKVLSLRREPEQLEPVIEAEARVVGDGEREVGGVGGRGPTPILPRPGAVESSPEREPPEADRRGRGGGED